MTQSWPAGCAGRTTLRVDPPIAHVAVAGAENVPSLVDLLNSSLGLGLYTATDLHRDIGDPTALVLVTRGEGGVTGGAVSRLLAPRDVDYYTRFGDPARRLFEATGPIGSISALAVAGSARRQGLGRRLVEASVDWCREQRCSAVVAVSWISGAEGTSAPLFAALGFTSGETVADFYLEESLRDGWTCPVCTGPCHCGGQFVYLNLQS